MKEINPYEPRQVSYASDMSTISLFKFFLMSWFLGFFVGVVVTVFLI